MIAPPAIRIRANDYDRLHHLADTAPESMTQTADFLRRELDRAEIVPEAAESVQMGSRVRFRDHDGDRVHELRLVYPGESDPAQGRVSILTPVGSALIGLETGATMPWLDRNGRTKRLTVLAVRT